MVARKICFVFFALLAGFFGIGATIRIGREILCLPYAFFFQPKKVEIFLIFLKKCDFFQQFLFVLI